MKEYSFLIFILFLLISITLFIIRIFLIGLENVANTLLVIGIIFVISSCIFLINSTIVIIGPTQIAIKFRLRQYTKYQKHGGIVFRIPWLEKIITYDSKIRTMWLSFRGAEGQHKQQSSDFDFYREKMLNKLFSSSDFYSYGQLIASGREGLNIICSVNYKIVNPIKLSRVFNQTDNKIETKSKFKTALATNLASSLRSTVARMTIDEIFEERQKLLDLLIRDSSELKEEWGIEPITVSLEELWLEDNKLQEMLDERKKQEIVGQASQLREELKAEMRNIVQKAEQDKKTIIVKALEQKRNIEQDTQKELAILKRQLINITGQAAKIKAEMSSKAVVLIAEAEAQSREMLEDIINDQLLKAEMVDVLPQIVDQMTIYDNTNFILVPSKKQMMYAALANRSTEDD